MSEDRILVHKTGNEQTKYLHGVQDVGRWKSFATKKSTMPVKKRRCSIPLRFCIVGGELCVAGAVPFGIFLPLTPLKKGLTECDGSPNNRCRQVIPYPDGTCFQAMFR
ncbi:MAG: hypothetical protein CSA33_01350 [Desulfobulbus propionicus]|nr:MAG: hypothetical protein CSA33_01350 [Desulfobulbus propionicus]